jgi:hypothetical protein
MGIEQEERIIDIIDEIETIQASQYQNWISALSKKHKVDRLHEELDKMAYEGERPPRTWNQIFK